jgi:DNA polymerase iota
MGKRIILAIDFDAFYCGVEEKRDPTLVGIPFIVYQKDCIATLSYSARALGLHKLGSVAAAVRAHPHVRLVNGESLAPYREQGKRLWTFVRAVLPGCTVERLGLEEMWVDVTALVESNLAALIETDVLFKGLSEEVADGLDQGVRLSLTTAAAPEATTGLEEFNYTESEESSAAAPLETSFLCEDFFFQTPAHVFPARHGTTMPAFLQTESTDPEEFYLDFKLYIASHIARELMLRISLGLGYSCSVGVATNKTLAKMVGSLHKPGGLTVLISSAVREFMAACHVRKVPYFGAKSRHTLQDAMGHDSARDGDLRVESVLSRYERSQFVKLYPPGQGDKLWALLQGEDDAPVLETGHVQKQVSIENTYKEVTSIPKAEQALQPLLESLLRQLRVDMIGDDGAWLSFPTVLRLSVRVATGPSTLSNRVSHSHTLTSFAPFYLLPELETSSELAKLAEKMRYSLVVPMLHKLCVSHGFRLTDPGPIYFQMLNVAATGVVARKPVITSAAVKPAPIGPVRPAKPARQSKKLDFYFTRK